MFLVYAGKLRAETEEDVGRVRAERASVLVVNVALVEIPLTLEGRKGWGRTATRLRRTRESMLSDQEGGRGEREREFYVGYPVLNDRERSLETPPCPINVRRRPMANPNSILAFESRFGPQSSLIDIAAFVQSASNLTPLQIGEVDHDVIEECRCVIFPLSPLAKWGVTRTGTVWTI